jgi:hypothetical protein
MMEKMMAQITMKKLGITMGRMLLGVFHQEGLVTVGSQCKVGPAGGTVLVLGRGIQSPQMPQAG